MSLLSSQSHRNKCRPNRVVLTLLLRVGAVSNDDEWRALAAMISAGLVDDDRFATHDAHKHHEDALDELIRTWSAPPRQVGTC